MVDMARELSKLMDILKELTLNKFYGSMLIKLKKVISFISEKKRASS